MGNADDSTLAISRALTDLFAKADAEFPPGTESIDTKPGMTVLRNPLRTAAFPYELIIASPGR